MTKVARIRQADMDRAVVAASRAMRRAGLDQARVVLDLTKSRIEIVIGESNIPQFRGPNPWDDE